MSALMDNPGAVINRLQAIDDDLAERQNNYEQAAEDLARAIRDFNLRIARATVVAKGSSEKTREAEALIAVASADDGIYETLKDAEGRYKALKAAVETLQSRASIGQSILRAQGRG